MLKSIKISNFKSINEEIELSFEPAIKKELDEYYFTEDNLLKIALIYGPNASGKTNIIKAIDFLRNFIFNPPKDKEEKIRLTPFKFTDTPKDTSKFILEFIENNFSFVYEIHISNNQVIYENLKSKDLSLSKPRYADVFIRKEEIKWGSKIKIKTQEKDILKLNTLPNISLLSAYLRVNLEIIEIEKVFSFFKKILPAIYPTTDLLGFVLEKLEKQEITKEEIIKVLKNADFAIDDFNIEEKEPEIEFLEFLKNIGKEEDFNNFKKIEIIFNHLQKYQLEFKEESLGTQRFYQLAAILVIVFKNSYIIPIDEIESSLHPDLLKFFILIFLSNSKNSQLILTTHTRELLFEKDILRKDVIWFCEKKEDLSTDLFSLSDFSEVRDNTSIYNYYKYGKFGAIPNIKNFLGIFDEKN